MYWIWNVPTIIFGENMGVFFWALTYVFVWHQNENNNLSFRMTRNKYRKYTNL